MNCYCGKNLDFTICCEPYIKLERRPTSAEDLMRSRYSAFCIKNIDYIIATTDLQVRFDFDRSGNEAWAQQAQFQKLEVINSEEIGNKSVVEFKAYFKIANEEHVHHEIGTFRRTDQVWFYRSGRVVPIKGK